MTTSATTKAQRSAPLRRNIVGAILGAGEKPSESDLVGAILNGLPISELVPLARLGFTDDELANSVDISRRTLARRRDAKGRLSVGEGDRLVRLARIVAQAINESFDTPQRAMHWLREPNLALGGYVPLEVIRTESGAVLVRRILGTLAYGGVL